MAAVVGKAAPFRSLRLQRQLCIPTSPLISNRRPLSTYGYEQAKALVYSKNGNPADVLSVHTHSIPPPHSDLVTLRTLAAPLNPADFNTVQGTYPTSPPFTTSLGTEEPVAVPGNEAVFSVISTGSAVTKVKTGDWVLPAHTNLGTWRTHLQVPETAIFPIDKNAITISQAAGVSVNPLTALQLLRWHRQHNSSKGKGLYIQNGANSAVGRMIIQLGKIIDYPGISIIRAREDKAAESALKEELKALGATHVFTDAEAYSKSFAEELPKLTNGGEQPILGGFNCVGGDALLGMAKLMSEGGKIRTYGAMSKAPLKIPTGLLIFKDLKFSGYWVSRWGEENPRGKQKALEYILQLYREKKLVEGPTEELKWDFDTPAEELVKAVQGTLEGYRKGKGMFVFGDT